MAKEKKDVKKNVLPHSKAKLDLYKNYLEHYLRVLCLAGFCTRINLYDIFCGSGVYDDGNIGSPLITKECIKDTHALLDTLSRPIKPISVTVNDKEEEKINRVRELLEQDKLRQCSFRYFNSDADEMLDRVVKEVNSFPSTERNLVFIDPYGYSKITKEKIYAILKNRYSEVILFLPVMQMYRFTDPALTYTEKTCYENLRKFISSFFLPNHKIHSGGINDIFEYINEVRLALSFNGEFYTASHYIEREKGNYYALFFMTSNLYGLDKMVEAKWKTDPVKGRGFNQKKRSSQTTMFQEEFEAQDYRMELDYLAQKLLAEINNKGFLTNNDVYLLCLTNGFRPTQANAVLKQLMKKNIKVEHMNAPPAGPASGFGINYENYSNDIVKVKFKK